MNISFSDEALKWFKEEMDIEEGDFVRFYVRYGGSSPLHESFSLGVNKEEPIDMGSKKEVDGTTFFVEENDLWFFLEHDLYVNFNEKLHEPSYEYKK
ncbi:HesB/YadR/YfhF family protein [Rossellomorea vietnamensis]|uniref:HesB/YadR/YfhF family protein n=1 Tax=Rossellomorea vietnamensis TaxID=218284 RepID=UPI003CF6A451